MALKKQYTQSFKEQAVQKAMQLKPDEHFQDLAESLGVGRSTLHTWIRQYKQRAAITTHESKAVDPVSNQKRPQDWNQEEKFEFIVQCSSLDEESINALCREKGLFPHHLQQWKQEFIQPQAHSHSAGGSSELKDLKQENKTLKKELQRKEKALAEAAALLVLKKKAQSIWGNDEDN